MNNHLAGLLIHRIQDKLRRAIVKGLEPTSYNTLSNAIYDSLSEINAEIETGECLTMPNGAEYTKTSTFENALSTEELEQKLIDVVFNQ